MTVKKKLALSLFDSRTFFFLFDRFSTVSFDHKAAEEHVFLGDTYMDIEWANSYNEADISSPDFQLPDWEFLRRHYSKTELREEEASNS